MINRQQVNHIAKLARIKLKEKEVGKLKEDLSSILDYFNSLKKVDVSNVEPTFHPAEHYFKERLDVMRQDRAESQPEQVVDKLIAAAPDKKKRHIKVKAVFK